MSYNVLADKLVRFLTNLSHMRGTSSFQSAQLAFIAGI